MGRNCAVLGCGNNSRCEPKPKFFKFPGEIKRTAARRQWVRNVNKRYRDGRPWQAGEDAVVCHKHFVDGKPSLRYPHPVLHMGRGTAHTVASYRVITKLNARTEVSGAWSSNQHQHNGMFVEEVPAGEIDNSTDLGSAVSEGGAQCVVGGSRDDDSSQLEDEDNPPVQQQMSLHIIPDTPALQEADVVKQAIPPHQPHPEQGEENAETTTGQETGTKTAGLKPYVCGVCGAWYHRLETASAHVQTHPETLSIRKRAGARTKTPAPRPYMCGVCGERYSTLGAATAHIQAHTTQGSSCKQEPDTETHMVTNTHIQTHIQEILPEDSVYKEVPATETQIVTKTHRTKSHSRVTEVSGCSMCDHGSCQLSYLHQHIITQEEATHDQHVLDLGHVKEEETVMGTVGVDATVVCEEGECFSTGDKLIIPTNYIITHEEATHDQHKRCSVCGLSISPSDLINHMLVHASGKPQKCSVCGKQFTQKSAVTRHMMTHTGEKLQKCSVCDKHFIQADHLKTHMMTHTGEKLHKCSVCDKHFAQSGHLKAHIRTHIITHEGEKPHKCCLCSEEFVYQNELRLHMKAHSVEDRYKCGVCSKWFSNLKAHMVTHEEELEGILAASSKVHPQC